MTTIHLDLYTLMRYLLFNTLQEHQTDLTFVRNLQVSDGFTMMVYEKIYLEIYMNNQYI